MDQIITLHTLNVLQFCHIYLNKDEYTEKYVYLFAFVTLWILQLQTTMRRGTEKIKNQAPQPACSVTAQLEITRDLARR